MLINNLNSLRILIPFFIITLYIGIIFPFFNLIYDPFYVFLISLFLFISYLAFNINENINFSTLKIKNIIKLILIIFLSLCYSYLINEFNILVLFIIISAFSNLFKNYNIGECLKEISFLLFLPALFQNFFISPYIKFILMLTGLIVYFLNEYMFFKNSGILVKKIKLNKNIIFIIILLILSQRIYDVFKNKNKRIVFDESKMNMESVEKDLNKNYAKSISYGHFNLYQFLKNSGFDISINKKSINYELLSKTDILVIIYPMKKYSKLETLLIKNYVNNGGSVLFIGDHTNIDNSSNSINSVSSEFGITYNFDTVWCMNDSKRNLIYADNPIFSDIKKVFFSVGCSLNINYPAKSLIKTKYNLFSDTGNKNNINNAFLGDQIYTKGEKTGFLDLAGICEYGKGKVIALGDSAYFQNPLIHENYRFALNLFNYLNYKKSIFSYIKNLFLVLSFILIIYFYFKYSFIQFRFNNSFLIFIIINIIIITLFNKYNTNYKILPNCNNKVLIDLSLCSKYNTYSLSHSSTDNDITSLFYELYRNNFWPFKTYDQLPIKKLSEFSFIIIENPLIKASSKYIDNIINYIKNGGNILIIDGVSNHNSLKNLYKKLNIKIGKSPLSILDPIVKEGNIVKLKKGHLYSKNSDNIIFKNINTLNFIYPTYIDNGNSLATIFNRSVISEFKKGKGKIIIIADEYFFSDKYNLKDDKIIDINKLKFIKNIFNYLKRYKE